ncbi:UDP-N-acetylmuramate dehydrogenase [Acetomicrobium sp.]|uniref:UDP-N-acetylmuramate dehydrogenase n=1 Tax=Acetomicrobium sp. TaxID=1872099 RepID=UPI002B262FF2|nr:UDP-N-acetylmuramate dehydrogenase [Acetomicrobium sp.]
MDRIITDKLIGSLNKICPNRVRTNQNLSDISSWRIGGIADCIVEPAGIKELQNVIKLAREEKVPTIVLGAATNLLFADEGLRALGIRIGKHMSQVIINGDTVVAEAGAWVPLLARKVGKAGLAGCEHIVGIPGTIGGLVYMNGGSKRRNIGTNVQSVICVDSDGKIVEMSNSECKFSYRSSVFQQENMQKIIVKVTLQFPERESPSEVRRRMLNILEERRKKFPKEYPNCGSVFLSDPNMYQQFGPPGLVIERCGLKGLRVGGAEVSTKHANFIVNLGEATAQDVLALIKYIHEIVCKKTGLLLKSEVRYVNEYGSILSINA